MKKAIKCANYFGFVLALCVMVISGCSCSTTKSDPLAEWQKYYGKLDKSIVADYENYIQKLSPDERTYMGPMFFYEDGTGQHAVRIETDIGGKDCWYHILFYDKENKRIKVVKYFCGTYHS